MSGLEEDIKFSQRLEKGINNDIIQFNRTINAKNMYIQSMEKKYGMTFIESRRVIENHYNTKESILICTLEDTFDDLKDDYEKITAIQNFITTTPEDLQHILVSFFTHPNIHFLKNHYEMAIENIPSEEKHSP